MWAALNFMVLCCLCNFTFAKAVIFLQLEVRPIIIWMAVGGVIGLDYKWEDVVVLDNICGPIIKLAFISIKEVELWIELAGSIGPTEKTCFLHPDTPVHIS